MMEKTQNRIQISSLIFLLIVSIELLTIENGWYEPWAIWLGFLVETLVISLILGGILKIFLRERTNYLTNICIIILIICTAFEIYLGTIILCN